MTQGERANSFGRSHKVFIVGQFPPPVHGFAVATDSMARLLEQRGYSIERISLTPVSFQRNLARSLRVRLCQLAKLAGHAKQNNIFYLALSGGARQVVDMAFLLVARVRGLRTILHHHSFAYVDRPTAIARAVFAIAGTKTTHLSLCETMTAALKKNYSKVRDVRVVSNAGLQRVSISSRERQSVKHIGYFSAITREKGALQFAAVSRQVAVRYPDLRFTMAGPCSDMKVMSELTEAQQNCSGFNYVGPLYGAEKAALLDSLDVLLFPTSYRNEAEPIAILEALAYGIPVIAWDRGCIGSILRRGADMPGEAIATDHPYLPEAVQRIEAWIEKPESFREASKNARMVYEQLGLEAVASLQSLFPLVS